MGMRSSDVTFLRREILPILAKTAELSPEAAEAKERLLERLADTRPADDITTFGFNRWHRVFTETGDPAGWHITLMVDDHEVPYIHGVLFDEGEHGGFVHLILDSRFGLDTSVEELEQWAPFLANAMAVSAGRTSHGPNSYVRNPHGRSGAGDPPELVGDPVVELQDRQERAVREGR